MPASAPTHLTPSLEVAQSLRDELIRRRLAEYEAEFKLHLAIRDLHFMGCPIDDISESTGLTPDEIRRVIDRGMAVFADPEMAQIIGVG